MMKNQLSHATDFVKARKALVEDVKHYLEHNGNLSRLCRTAKIDRTMVWKLVHDKQAYKRTMEHFNRLAKVIRA